MWWARSEVLDLYLSGQTLALRAPGLEPRRATLESGAWQDPLQAWLAELPRRRWRVWLGGQRCRLHLLDPIAGVRSIEEAEAALAAILSAEGDAVDVRLAAWPAASEASWLAASLPAGLALALTESIESQGGSLSALRPWWMTVSHGELACAAMCDDEAISYWRSARGRVEAAASLPVSAASRAATLQRLGVGGALSAWQLDLGARAPAGRAGFAIIPVQQEDADVAARASV